jgi:hypothetical protein
MSGTQTQTNTQVDPELEVTPPAGTDDSNNSQSEDLGDFSDPVKAAAEIKKLRAEAAKHRTRAKNLDGEMLTMKSTLDKLKQAFGGEDQEIDPAEQLQAIQQQNENYQVELGILQLAREHSISPDQDDYFRFLLTKKFEGLEEGGELTDEDLQEVIQKVQGVSGMKQNPASTGVNAGKKDPAGNGKSSVSAEQFAKMTLTEKSKLYVSDAALYSRLLTEANEKRLI